MGITIYVADDEYNIRQLIQAYLAKEGYEVECFANGESLLRAMGVKRPDLIVLDVMMPGTDGLSACSYIRRKSDVPILIISARGSEMDKVVGLQSGGDDYLVKPFGMLEMSARIKSLLRRSDMSLRNCRQEKTAAFGDLRMDESAHEVTCRKEPFSVTPAEYEFLKLVLKDSSRAYSRKTLLEALWQCDSDMDTRAPDDMIKRLRRKLESAGSNVLIQTVWGYGYRLALKEDKGE